MTTREELLREHRDLEAEVGYNSLSGATKQNVYEKLYSVAIVREAVRPFLDDLLDAARGGDTAAATLLREARDILVAFRTGTRDGLRASISDWVLRFNRYQLATRRQG